jgi:high-affinity nickel-transport protein
MNAILTGGGPIARLLRPLFRLISRPWHLYPLGLLFGLGFDTATEIGLLGIAAVQASQSLPIWSILVPGALHRRYGAGRHRRQRDDDRGLPLGTGQPGTQALLQPDHHLHVGVGGIAGGRSGSARAGRGALGLHGGVWDYITALTDNFGMIGYLIVGIFILTWGVSRGVLPLQGLRPPGRDACPNLFFLSSPGKALASHLPGWTQCFGLHE